MGYDYLMDKVFTYQMFTLNCRYILNRKSTVLKSIIYIFCSDLILEACFQVSSIFKYLYFLFFFYLSLWGQKKQVLVLTV